MSATAGPRRSEGADAGDPEHLSRCGGLAGAARQADGAAGPPLEPAVVVSRPGEHALRAASMGRAYRRRIRSEESLLSATFGEEDVAGMRRTWRLITGVY